jgi:hypothetical protein
MLEAGFAGLEPYLGQLQSGGATGDKPVDAVDKPAQTYRNLDKP